MVSQAPIQLRAWLTNQIPSLENRARFHAQIIGPDSRVSMGMQVKNRFFTLQLPNGRAGFIFTDQWDPWISDFDQSGRVFGCALNLA